MLYIRKPLAVLSVDLHGTTAPRLLKGFFSETPAERNMLSLARAVKLNIPVC